MKIDLLMEIDKQIVIIENKYSDGWDAWHELKEWLMEKAGVHLTGLCPWCTGNDTTGHDITCRRPMR